MKSGLIIIAALILGSIAAHFLLQNNGYVLINFRGYTVEMSVPILALIIVLAYLAVRFMVRLWRAPRQLGEITARARAERSGRQITRGLVAMSEGRLARGERLLTKGAANSEAPLVNYLAAARAAQAQGDHVRRDGWLKMAYEHDGDARNTVLLTQAELQIAGGELEQARASLNRVLDRQPQHPTALTMLARLHRRNGEWDALAGILPALRKARTVPATDLDAWTMEASVALLGAAGIGRARIDALWKAIPRQLRRDAALVRARAKALIEAGATADAEAEIRKSLKHEWDEALVTMYGEIDSAQPDAQLRQLESWLAGRPEDPALLLAAGRACTHAELWGKARSYIESSIAIRPSPDAFHELGQLMLRLDDREAATSAFAKGLTLSYKGAPDVPRLASDSATVAAGDASVE